MAFRTSGIYWAAGLVLAAGVAWALSQQGGRHAVTSVSAQLPDRALPARAVLEGLRADAPDTAIPLDGLPNDLAAAFERSPDLHAYRQRLKTAAERGDVQAAWVASQVDEYCANVAQDPQAFANDTRAIAGLSGQGADAIAAARARVGQRCAGFSPRDGVNRAAIVAERQQAARGGNLAAEASLLALGAPLQDSDAYRRDLADRVQASRDPQAYLALSTAMGAAASGEDAYQGLVAGTSFSELAWQLAACRLGLPCGPDSVLMTSYCANGGICSRDASQDFQTFVLDAAVPRQGADTIEDMVNRLVQSARQGEGT